MGSDGPYLRFGSDTQCPATRPANGLAPSPLPLLDRPWMMTVEKNSCFLPSLLPSLSSSCISPIEREFKLSGSSLVPR